MTTNTGNILERVNNPEDLRKLDQDQLIDLCRELRSFIIDSVSQNPGHFGASLGVVELTVAIHYAFNTPYDKLIWDVGHQAYAHKILTGRRDRFHLNRKLGGISGFPKMSESPYDAFGTGHSSTSISAALGMAVASSLKGENRHHIAVIGDGSLTGGLAFEGLNNAGASMANLLVIVNDNGIAIDQSVGALKEYLADVTTSRTYNRLKDEMWKLLGSISRYIPDTRSFFQKMENAVKATLLKHSNFFESLNFRYFGPVDGHDVQHLTRILQDLRQIRGPKLLHVRTIKGKGFRLAEEQQTRFHAPGLFNKETGEVPAPVDTGPQAPRYQDVFGHTLLELARSNPAIVGITPAMPTGSSMNIMMGEMPERTFDVGIAEQHAVTFAAGLATQGLLPFCNIYSSFFQRAYDQFVHDVALQGLPVVFCLDRAGLVGEDGATHHGAYDLSFLRCIPGVVIAAPMDETELRNMMYSAQLNPSGPYVIRYPRGNGISPDWRIPFSEIPVGKGRELISGDRVAVIGAGPVGNRIMKICRELGETSAMNPGFYDIRFVKPLDHDLLDRVINHYQTIITVEDNARCGGMGSAVLEYLSEKNAGVRLIRLGIPDVFIEQGSPSELYALCGFDEQGIRSAIMEAWK